MEQGITTERVRSALEEMFKQHHASTSCPSNDEFAEMQRQAREFDYAKYDAVNQSPLYLEWFNARPLIVQEAIRAKPYVKYYTDAKTQKEVLRLYGVAEDKSRYGADAIIYHVVRAGFFRVIDCLYRPDELLVIEEWSEDHLWAIRCSGVPKAFLSPDGWMHFLFHFGPEEEEEEEEEEESESGTNKFKDFMELPGFSVQSNK